MYVCVWSEKRRKKLVTITQKKERERGGGRVRLRGSLVRPSEKEM